jgi:hypothetical protein
MFALDAGGILLLGNAKRRWLISAPGLRSRLAASLFSDCLKRAALPIRRSERAASTEEGRRRLKLNVRFH